MAKSNYQNLMNEISKLQSQADNLRKQEVKDVIIDIQEKMRVYGLASADLDGSIRSTNSNKGAVRRGRPMGSKNVTTTARIQAQSNEQSTEKKAGRKATAKFRDPQSGVTWSGRGRMPKWISSAISEGKTKEEFAIS